MNTSTTNGGTFVNATIRIELVTNHSVECMTHDGAIAQRQSDCTISLVSQLNTEQKRTSIDEPQSPVDSCYEPEASQTSVSLSVARQGSEITVGDEIDTRQSSFFKIDLCLDSKSLNTITVRGFL